MNKSTIFNILLAVLLSGLFVFLGFTNDNTDSPREVYRVYLAGESIGIIDSKEELESYIDREQSHLKEQYKVDKVYAPKELDIIKEITYDQTTSSSKEIYDIIQTKTPFTIQGYKVLIRGIEEQTETGETVKSDDQVIYVLNKEIFINSVYRTAQAFIDKNELAAYENDKQSPITDTGKIIENIYIQNEQTITQENIPVNEKIYTTVEELSKYLLFGTTENQQTYVVKEGDTINDISFNNQISPEEFLVANTNFRSTDDLLYPGQSVVLGILKPQLNIIEENHIVERQTSSYETVYENDPDQYVGYERVKQEGSEGIKLVTQKTKVVNGETRNVVVTDTVEEKPSVDRVIVRGTKQRVTSSGGGIDDGVEVPVAIGSWVWPTRSPYIITSRFAWRWGKLHQGLDISGSGFGSPIRAANNGIIVYSGYNSTNGHFIYIKHSNGRYTEYAHMATRYKKAGDIVYAGDVIGTMGQTGYAYGVHLHFGLWTGYPQRSTPLNPLTLY